MLLILQRKDTGPANLCSPKWNAGQCGNPEDEVEYTCVGQKSLRNETIKDRSLHFIWNFLIRVCIKG